VPTTPTPISLDRPARGGERLYYPQVFGTVNDHVVYAENLQGDFIWHQHEREQLYVCVAGEVVVEFRDATHTLRPLQALIIPAGVEHRPLCPNGARVIIVEPKTMFDAEQSSSMYDAYDKAQPQPGKST